MKSYSSEMGRPFIMGLGGALCASYLYKNTDENLFGDIHIQDGLLIGGAFTLACLIFLIIVPRIEGVSKDLIAGPSHGNKEAIHRKLLYFTLLLLGSGIGFLGGGILFELNSIGFGLSQAIPGVTISAVIIRMQKKAL